MRDKYSLDTDFDKMHWTMKLPGDWVQHGHHLGPNISLSNSQNLIPRFERASNCRYVQ